MYSYLSLLAEDDDDDKMTKKSSTDICPSLSMSACSSSASTSSSDSLRRIKACFNSCLEMNPFPSESKTAKAARRSLSSSSFNICSVGRDDEAGLEGVGGVVGDEGGPSVEEDPAVDRDLLEKKLEEGKDDDDLGREVVVVLTAEVKEGETDVSRGIHSIN